MEKKLNSLIISFFVLFTLSTVLLAVFSVFGVLYTDSNEFIAESGEEQNLDVLVDVSENTLGTTEDLGQEYIDKMIFLGESTTYGLQRYGVLSGGQNTNQVWTGAVASNGKVISSGTLSLSPSIAQAKIFYPDNASAITIGDAVSLKSPEYLVITLGLNNGASYYTEQEFKQCYRLLLNSIPKSKTKIILQSLFPVSRRCEIAAYTPARLAECNGWIQDIAVEYGLKYLNTTEALADSEGYLYEEFDNGGDGIHLNGNGLKTVLMYIRTHGYS